MIGPTTAFTGGPARMASAGACALRSLTAGKGRHMELSDLHIIDIFKALADPNRLQIFQLLLKAIAPTPN